MRVGRIRRKLSEMIFDAVAVDVRLEELNVIPNGGSPVYDPPRWDGHGVRSPSGTQVRVFSWSSMADLVKYGIEAGKDDGYDLELHPKVPKEGS